MWSMVKRCCLKMRCIDEVYWCVAALRYGPSSNRCAYGWNMYRWRQLMSWWAAGLVCRTGMSRRMIAVLSAVPDVRSVALIHRCCRLTIMCRHWLTMMCSIDRQGVLHRSSGLSAKEPTKMGLFFERDLPMQKAWWWLAAHCGLTSVMTSVMQECHDKCDAGADESHDNTCHDECDAPSQVALSFWRDCECHVYIYIHICIYIYVYT